MKFGDLELYLLVSNRMKFDGGMAFGVVPKALWEKQRPADADNLVEAACVGVVARHRGKVIVCETGIGNKLPEKRARQVVLREPEGLLESLGRIGVRPDEVDIVLSTHLHWDHAGGFTRRNAHGEVEVTFPKAKHFVQRAEWDFAQSPDPRSRAGYIEEDYLPAAEAGVLEFLDESAEILPGLEVRLTGGHTPGHQVCVIRSGELACAVTGDLVPMRPHLRVPWNLGADLDVLRVMEEKAQLLSEASRHRWLLVLSHEVDGPAGYLAEDGQFQPEPELSA